MYGALRLGARASIQRPLRSRNILQGIAYSERNAFSSYFRNVHTSGEKDLGTSMDASFPPSTTSKKVKRDLRPSPTKTAIPPNDKDKPLEFSGSSTTMSAAPTAFHPSTNRSSEIDTTSVPVAHPLTTASPGNQVHKSLWDNAKEDIQQANAHGVLLPPPTNASTLGKLYHQAKELFKFYLAGLKLIFSNKRHADNIRARVKAGGPPMSRWETRFVATCDSDLMRLVPFVLILLILEEALPFFVLYAPWLLPSTCLLSTQKVRIEAKRVSKHAELVSKSLEQLKQISNSSSFPNDFKLMCGILSLSTFGPNLVLRRRLLTHLNMLALDDKFLLAEAFKAPRQIAGNLSHDEIAQVLAERGLCTSTTESNKIYLERYFDQVQTQELPTFQSKLQFIAQNTLHSYISTTSATTSD